MFFQPTYMFPWLEPFQPLRNSAILALVAYIFSGNKPKTPFFKEKINVFFLFFVMTQVLSAAQIWLTGALDMFNSWLKLGIIYFLIVKSATSEKRVVFLALSIILGISYLSYYSLSKFVINYVPGTRAGGFGWYDGSNDLAIILVVAISLVLLIANFSRSKLIKYFFVFVSGVFAFNILFAGSRNGLLGLLVVGVISLYSFKKMSVFIKGILAVILLSAVFTVGMTNVLHRSDLSGQISNDASSLARIDQWKTGLHILKIKPLLGIGPNQFTALVGDYGGVRGLDMHNTLLQVFVETGLLGGLFFSLFSFLPLIYISRVNKDTYKSVGMYKFIVAGLCGFWICAFFSNRYDFYILYVLVALLVSIKVNLLKEKIA